MRPRSRLNGVRYRLSWKLRVLRSNLDVVYEDVKDWVRWRWGTPAVSVHPLCGFLIVGGGQRHEIRVEDARPSRVATAYLRAVELIAAEERRAARRVSA